MTQRPSARRVTFLTLGVLLVGLAVLVAWKAVRLVEIASRLQQEGREALALVKELQKDPANATPLIALTPQLARVSADLSTLQDEARPLEPLLRATRPLPTQFNWPASIPDLLAAGVPLLQAGTLVAAPFSDAARASEAAPQQERLRLYLAAIGTLSRETPRLRERLNAAEAALHPLRGRPLGGPLEPMGPILERSDELFAGAPLGLDLLAAAAPALGMDRPRSYLLLGQNSAEIRATGGFIGSMGAVTLDGGAVVGLEYGSSYTPDEGVIPIPAPPPMARYMGLGGWYLRDANWWPDFPASAAQVEQAWLRAGRAPVDGVIAMDTTAVETLLGLVGPIQVEGYGEVSVENFDRAAAEQLYSSSALANYTTFQEAKNAFLGAVGHALVERLLGLSPADALPLGQGLLQLLREKHLLLAFKEQSLVQMAHANGWDGSIPPPEGDSLYVVDTTVSYGDSYPYIATEDALTVTLSEDGSQYHELVLDYINSYPQGVPSWVPLAMLGGGTFDPASGKVVAVPGFWGGWLRVYLPPDARVVSTDGLVDPVAPETESQRTVVAGYLPMRPGEHRAVTLRYVTRAGSDWNEDGYRLRLQKQPGLAGRKITVRVSWPNGESALYQGRPETDIEVALRPGEVSNEGSE